MHVQVWSFCNGVGSASSPACLGACGWVVGAGGTLQEQGQTGKTCLSHGAPTGRSHPTRGGSHGDHLSDNRSKTSHASPRSSIYVSPHAPPLAPSPLFWPACSHHHAASAAPYVPHHYQKRDSSRTTAAMPLHTTPARPAGHRRAQLASALLVLLVAVAPWAAGADTSAGAYAELIKWIEDDGGKVRRGPVPYGTHGGREGLTDTTCRWCG